MVCHLVGQMAISHGQTGHVPTTPSKGYQGTRTIRMTRCRTGMHKKTLALLIKTHIFKSQSGGTVLADFMGITFLIKELKIT